MRFSIDITKGVVLTIAALVLGGVGQARAGIFVTGNSALFNVNITNDPAGNNFSGTAPLNGGPTLTDNGLLNVSESITPVNATTAWIQFTFSTPNNAPLAGTPSGFWQTQVTDFTTTNPARLANFYFTYQDASGASHPFPFGGYTISSIDPNPGGVTGPVAETPPGRPPYTYRTSGHSLTLGLQPFDAAPTDFENGGPVPTTFVFGGEYVLQPSAVVPEPASLTLLGMGVVGLMGYAGLRRGKKAAPVS